MRVNQKWDYGWLRIIIVLSTGFTLQNQHSLAQVIPDTTLGNENSIVNPNATIKDLPATLIEGGAERGANLFHSFSEFSIGDLQRVYFANPTGIERIFSRVTGNNISNINGLLGVVGNADLFFLNPNGIIFGQNASLDVNGSFIGSTADSLVFGDEFTFSASNPTDVPALLTVNILPGLQYGNNPGTITNLSVANGVGLQVPTNETIGLVGGDIEINGGVISAFGGRVELGGVGENSLVIVDSVDNGYTFNYDGVEQFQDITLNSALVDVSGEGGGDLQVVASNITLKEFSRIDGGTFGEISGGTLSFNASDSIKLNGSSNIIAGVQSQATGNSNNIILSAKSLVLQDRSNIAANTFGEGDAGEIVIVAEDIELIGSTTENNLNTKISADNVQNSTGDAGNINIQTNNLYVLNGAQIGVGSFGTGKAGNLNIEANNIEVVGESDNQQNPSSLSTQVILPTGNNESNLIIKTNRLKISNRAEISASTFGDAEAGNIKIEASEIELTNQGFIGSQSNNQFSTGIGGNVEIYTDYLQISDGARVSVSSLGNGEAGDLTINANKIEIIGSSINRFTGLFSESNGRGDGGELRVNTNSLKVTDGAQVSASTFGNGGNAGNLTINTASLLIENAGQISSNTFGQGNGGNVLVNASESVKVISNTRDGNFLSSVITAFSFLEATGNAGNLTIFTSDLLLENGGVIATATIGAGNSGNITINSSSIKVIGRSTNGRVASRISTQSADIATGDAGDLTINTDNLFIENGAQVDSGTSSIGKGGNLIVNVSNLLQISDTRKEFSTRSGLFTQTEGAGDAQNLTITTNKLIVQDGARISASTGNSGNAGDLKINAKEIELMGTTPDGRFSGGLFVNSFGTGDGGELNITTEQLSILDGARISASSNNIGEAGNLEIKTQSLNLDDSAITTETDVGDGGNITLQINDLLSLRNNSQISTTAGRLEAGGDGGDITINSDLIVAFPEENSDITANAFDGRGGNINITTQGIFGLEFRPEQTDFSDITASSQFGLNGEVTINTPDVNPAEGLINLPQTFAIPPLDTSCQAQNSSDSSFVNLGRGGLPENPREVRSESETWDDLRPPAVENLSNKKTQSIKYNPIIEAQNWIVGENGNIILVSNVDSKNYKNPNLINSCKNNQ